MSADHAGYHASCFLEPTDPPSCRCNHACHREDAEICTGEAAVLYKRLGHEDEVIQQGNVCTPCAAAMDEFAEHSA